MLALVSVAPTSFACAEWSVTNICAYDLTPALVAFVVAMRAIITSAESADPSFATMLASVIAAGAGGGAGVAVAAAELDPAALVVSAYVSPFLHAATSNAADATARSALMCASRLNVM